MTNVTSTPAMVAVSVVRERDLYRAKSGRWNVLSLTPEIAAAACAARVLECGERDVVASDMGETDGVRIFHCRRRPVISARRACA